MAGNEATSQGTTEVAENAAELDALLGGETADSGASEAPQTEESAEEPEVAETEQGGEEETPAEEEGAGDGTEEVAETEEGESEEPADEESELSIEDSDRDYSDAAYKKAADHFARTKKIQLDPNDPAHRALLKEIIDRGEALKRQKAAEEAETEEGADEEARRAAAEAQPTKPTTEQIQSFISNSARVAKQHIIPEVAQAMTKRVGNAMAQMFWPDQDVDFNPTPEQAAEFTEALSQAFWMQMEQAIPAIQGATRDYLSRDEVFGHVETVTIRERALERLEAATDKTTGKALYPDLEKLAMGGSIKKVMKANPWIGNIVSGDGRNRVLNEAARIDAAYKIARGEQVNPDVVRRAHESGKKAVTDRNKRIAAGRTTPGKTQGEIGRKAKPGQQLVSDITGGSGSAFARAVANDMVSSLRK